MPFFFLALFYFLLAPVNLNAEEKKHEAGELCLIKNDKGGFSGGKCVISRGKSYDINKTAAHCRRRSSGMPLITSASEKCYADYECSTGYCKFKKSDLEGVNPDFKGKEGGTCSDAPAGFPTKTAGVNTPHVFKGEDRLTPFPAVAPGKDADQACSKNEECSSQACYNNKCEVPKYCLACTIKDETPVPGAPCCGGLGLNPQSHKCEGVDNSQDHPVEMLQLFGAVPSAFNGQINVSRNTRGNVSGDPFKFFSMEGGNFYLPMPQSVADKMGQEAYTESSSVLGNNDWNVSIIDSKKSCEFSYSGQSVASGATAIPGVSENQGAFLSASQLLSAKIKKELAVRSGILEILKFLYLYKHPVDPELIPIDPYGMHNGVLNILVKLQKNDIENTHDLIKFEKEAEIKLDISKFQLFLAAQDTPAYKEKLKNIPPTSQALADLYAETGGGGFMQSYKTSKAEFKKFFDDNPSELQLLIQSLKNPYDKGTKSLQAEAINLMVQQSKNLHEIMLKRATALNYAGEALLVNKDSFKQPQKYAVKLNAKGANKPTTMGTQDYALKDMILGRGSWARASQGINIFTCSQEELEDDGDCDSLSEGHFQYNAFYKTLENGYCDGEEDYLEDGDEGEISDQADHDEDWQDDQTYFCVGQPNKNGNDRQKGGFRVGNSAFISTFPAYVFGPKGEMEGEVKLPEFPNFPMAPNFINNQAIRNAQENLKRYIEDPIEHTRDIAPDVKAKLKEQLKWENDMKIFLDSVAQSENVLRGFLKYLSQGTPRQFDDTVIGGENYYDYIHPLYFAPEFLEVMGDNIGKIQSYYQKMSAAFLHRENCLKGVLEQINASNCKAGESCAPGLDRSTITAPVAAAIKNNSVDVKRAGGERSEALKEVGMPVTGNLGNLNSSSTLSAGGAGNSSSQQMLSKLGKALQSRISAHNAKMAASKKARNDFNKKWGNTRYARVGSPLANMSDDDLKKMMDNMKAASLKSMAPNSAAGSSSAPGALLAPPKEGAQQEVKKEETKTESELKKSGSSESGGGDYRSGSSYNSGSGGYARNDGGSGADGKANKNDIIEAVKKNPGQYNNQESDSIFKIITNRYMKSLNKILPNE